ncbi:putative kinase [Rubidibacter lacunae KORDI 51-2]|uniref:Putative kinase n=1 Tax=Rubidibacter lacunae KORDI 51-2 TaxID=582515 RepID=U5DSV0_9CHRO|nr:AAA family ATPase [Rubidibacter lacunae]ERN42765.1 putative kinase [Rubidibacter lacunae KORDI 51-2]
MTIPLILLIGLPGSGKSTFARAVATDFPDTQIVSTDAIRADLYGNAAIQGSWLHVWKHAEVRLCRAVESIRRGHCPGAIYDATNVVRRHRRDAIACARACGFTRITGVFLDLPLPMCLQHNDRRDRVVPTEVMLGMDRKLRAAPPSHSDGLDALLHYQRRASADIARRDQSDIRTSDRDRLCYPCAE